MSHQKKKKGQDIEGLLPPTTSGSSPQDLDTAQADIPVVDGSVPGCIYRLSSYGTKIENR